MNEVESFFNNLREGKIQKIPEEQMKDAETKYEKNKNYYKKVKKCCVDILDMVCEAMELKRDLLMETIGIEGDTDMVTRLKININNKTN